MKKIVIYISAVMMLVMFAGCNDKGSDSSETSSSSDKSTSTKITPEVAVKEICTIYKTGDMKKLIEHMPKETKDAMKHMGKDDLAKVSQGMMILSEGWDCQSPKVQKVSNEQYQYVTAFPGEANFGIDIDGDSYTMYEVEGVAGESEIDTEDYSQSDLGGDDTWETGWTMGSSAYSLLNDNNEQLLIECGDTGGNIYLNKNGESVIIDAILKTEIDGVLFDTVTEVDGGESSPEAMVMWDNFIGLLPSSKKISIPTGSGTMKFEPSNSNEIANIVEICEAQRLNSEPEPTVEYQFVPIDELKTFAGDYVNKLVYIECNEVGLSTIGGKYLLSGGCRNSQNSVDYFIGGTNLEILTTDKALARFIAQNKNRTLRILGEVKKNHHNSFVTHRMEIYEVQY